MNDFGRRCFSRLESCRVPVIAAIERVCMGAALELALCCDIRIAAGGTIWPARELIYSARRNGAVEASRIGLVNAVHPADELGACVAELAAEIAANAPPAVLAANRSINGGDWRGLRSGLEREAAEATGPPLSKDREAGMRAAARRERADFSGR